MRWFIPIQGNRNAPRHCLVELEAMLAAGALTSKPQCLPFPPLLLVLSSEILSFKPLPDWGLGLRITERLWQCNLFQPISMYAGFYSFNIPPWSLLANKM